MRARISSQRFISSDIRQKKMTVSTDFRQQLVVVLGGNICVFRPEFAHLTTYHAFFHSFFHRCGKLWRETKGCMELLRPDAALKDADCNTVRHSLTLSEASRYH
jgi:hypothetical protein